MRRRARPPSGQNILGVALIGVALLALAGFAFAGLALRPPPTDPETLCRTDQAPAAHTVILVDTSDRLEARHRRKLQAVVAQERARLGEYDRLTLMRLNPRKPQEPSILFSKCLPLPPERANPFVQNPRLAQENWNSEFADALASALRSAQSSGPARASPLLAGLRAVAADPDFGAEISQRRLVMMSDLLEHDPNGFSLYADDATYAAWRSASALPPADLDQIDLRIVPVDRPDHAAAQTNAVENFWPAYADDAHVRSLSFDPAP